MGYFRPPEKVIPLNLARKKLVPYRLETGRSTAGILWILCAVGKSQYIYHIYTKSQLCFIHTKLPANTISEVER